MRREPGPITDYTTSIMISRIFELNRRYKLSSMHTLESSRSTLVVHLRTHTMDSMHLVEEVLLEYYSYYLPLVRARTLGVCVVSIIYIIIYYA